MEALIDFAAVGAAIVLSLGIALSLEWFTLNTLMKMMPVEQPVITADASGSAPPLNELEESAADPELAAAAYLERKRAA